MPDGRVALRHDDLERTRRANAERLLHLRVTDPGAVLGGDDLEFEGIPVFRPISGSASSTRIRVAAGP